MTDRQAAEMGQAAKDLLGLLDDTQRTRLRAPFGDDATRRSWDFVPRPAQPGLRLAHLTPDQQHAVFDLLSTALSESALARAITTIGFEHLLYRRRYLPELRDTTNYALMLFGDPGSGSWGWRFQGHHLSLNVTVVEGRVASRTPFFLGANPSRVESDGYELLRPLGDVEDVARELVRMLTPGEREHAVVSHDAPPELTTGTSVTVADRGGDPGIPGVAMDLSDRQAALVDDLRYDPRRPLGLSGADMSPAGEAALQRLVDVHTGMTAEPDAMREALGTPIHFAWAGSLEPRQPHYYRIQAPAFLIEYDNSQGSGRHVHLVHRHPARDFADDLLREHLAVGRDG